jgi:hypothetical protein
VNFTTSTVWIDIWLADVQKVRSQTTDCFFADESDDRVQEQTDNKESIADVDVSYVLFDFNQSVVEELDFIRVVRMLS